MTKLYFEPDAQLTAQDRIVLDTLKRDLERNQKRATPQTESAEDSDDSGVKHTQLGSHSPEDTLEREKETIAHLKDVNNPTSTAFEPSVFFTFDIKDMKSPFVHKWIIDPYVRWGRSVVRVDTDVVMLTHLLVYFSTSLPSAIYLFYDFRWWHGILHAAMQLYYMGPYTLMMHQHIHMRGILNKKYWIIDSVFPYITDPLHGHTWNSYYFHHVKHHHVEGNGPDDLSTTIRLQRDDVWDFMRYVGRFYFLVWFDLPMYFFRKRKPGLALKTGSCELLNYAFVYTMFTYVNARATLCTLLIPLLLMRIALMVGNWGQHAFVDEVEPDSDFRSSITLVDVPSNRYCYNDGYHTSHHLNPLRHWRDHPIAFLAQKQQYADEHALVFYNIDYFFLTINLLRKNYTHLARCLVPIGEQVNLTMEERVELLKRKTRKFTEEEIAAKWGKQYARTK